MSNTSGGRRQAPSDSSNTKRPKQASDDTEESNLGFPSVGEFTHSNVNIDLVLSLLQSMKGDNMSAINHHANGLVPSLQSINRPTLVSGLSGFATESINFLLQDKFDINLIPQDKAIALQKLLHEGEFKGTLDDISCSYLKIYSMLVSEWKSAKEEIDKNRNDYSEDLKTMVTNVNEKINALDLEDDHWYSFVYIGESAYQSFKERAIDGGYPGFMYELAELFSDREVIEIKISSSIACDDNASLFNESLFAVLLMQATNNTRRQNNHGDVKCHLILYKGDSGNKVRTGQREHFCSKFTSSGYCIVELLRRNFKSNGGVEVFGDGFVPENLVRGTTSQMVNCFISYTKSNDEQIRAYIANDELREKNGRLVIKDPDHKLTLADAGHHFCHRVGCAAVEKCRGIFSDEYIENRARSGLDKMLPLLRRYRDSGKRDVDMGDGTTILVVPEKEKGFANPSVYVERVWGYEKGDPLFWVKEALIKEKFDFSRHAEGTTKKMEQFGAAITNKGKSAEEEVKAIEAAEKAKEEGGEDNDEDCYW